jgi:hypothetical protein
LRDPAEQQAVARRGLSVRARWCCAPAP